MSDLLRDALAEAIWDASYAAQEDGLYADLSGVRRAEANRWAAEVIAALPPAIADAIEFRWGVQYSLNAIDSRKLSGDAPEPWADGFRQGWQACREAVVAVQPPPGMETAYDRAALALDAATKRVKVLEAALRHIAECPGSPTEPLEPDWQQSLIRHLQAAAREALAGEAVE